MKVTDFVCEIPRQVRLGDILHLCRLHAKSQLQVLARYLTLRVGAAPSHGRSEDCERRGLMLKGFCVSWAPLRGCNDCVVYSQRIYKGVKRTLKKITSPENMGNVQLLPSIGPGVTVVVDWA